MASEVRGATVSVRGEPPKTQSVMDLSAIMTEFQNAINGQLSPDDAQGHFDLGVTYLEMEMTEQALTEFRMARESETHRGAALEMMARCYLGAGRPADALTAVEEAAGTAGDDPGRQAALFAYRGLALEALGRLPEATHALEHALSIEPGLDLAREAILRLRGSRTGEAAA
jgi:tetratricopeptide (TPR) repeat protein